MLRRTLRSLSLAPIVGRSAAAPSPDDAAVEPAAPDAGLITTTRMAPKVINSGFGDGDRTPHALALKEEERRQARREKKLDDMIVFEGGAIADHETLGDKMMMRDYVHYSMYHHKWGYYPKLQRKYRELMTTGFFDPIPFGNLRNRHDYETYVAKVSERTPTFATPPALFQPYYGWVLAEYFITVMRAKFDPAEPLIIYEIGAGVGTLALNILDYLAEQFPEIYAKCEYHLIEMNPTLIPIQRRKLVHHAHKAKLHHISIHNWRELEPRRCFVLGIELMCNMPHDLVTWTKDGTCYEQWMEFAEKDNLSSATERTWIAQDPMVLRYLRYTDWLQEDSMNSLKVLCNTDGQQTIDPPRWADLEPRIYDPLHLIATKTWNIHNPWRMCWIPVGQMVMLEVLSEFFPRHHAFFADWNFVASPLMGMNGPVVQNKIRVAKDIFLRRVTDHFHANAGMVDVCFPTDFERLNATYKNICGEHKEVTTMSHPDFWNTFGGDKTSIFTTQSGFNPMLEDFGTFTVYATHHPSEL